MKPHGIFDGPSGDRKGGRVPPLLISLLAMALLSLIAYFLNVPNPNIILLTGVVFFTAVYGYGAGIAASIVMVAYSMFFFSEGHSWVHYSALNLQKLSVIALGAVANILLIGSLRRRHSDAIKQLQERNQYLHSDNLSLEEASLTDALTGVRNRFSLRRDYGKFENRFVHVMMMDLDGFRRVNDTYGHAVGDYILKRVGQLLCEAFGADRCYRYGGDIFLILCADMDRDAFPEKLNIMKQGMNAIRLDDKSLPTHFSAGYVYGDCEYSQDLRLMIHQADDNLCQAKRRGRDCCVGTPFLRDEAETAEQASRAHERRIRNGSDLFAG